VSVIADALNRKNQYTLNTIIISQSSILWDLKNMGAEFL